GPGELAELAAGAGLGIAGRAQPHLVARRLAGARGARAGVADGAIAELRELAGRRDVPHAIGAGGARLAGLVAADQRALRVVDAEVGAAVAALAAGVPVGEGAVAGGLGDGVTDPLERRRRAVAAGAA